MSVSSSQITEKRAPYGAINAGHTAGRCLLPFVKMHGLGNDFIVIDGISDPWIAEVDLAVHARDWCDRRTGVGADGVLLIGPHAEAHAVMTVFNADGSSAQMCGNGIRCVCKYLHGHGIVSARPMRIATGAGVLSLDYEVVEGTVACVTVDMGQPILDHYRIPVALQVVARDGSVVNIPMQGHVADETLRRCADQPGIDLHMTAVSMGNPHLILYCDRVEAIDLAAIGPMLEHDALFPERINVHLVQVVDTAEVRMRTWERGSGRTQACGTGTCAVCVAGVLTQRGQRRITAHLPGGALHLHWDEATNHVMKTGPAEEVYTGTIAL